MVGNRFSQFFGKLLRTQADQIAAAKIADLEVQVDKLKTQIRRSRTNRASGVPIRQGRFTYETTPELMDKNRWATLRNMATDAHVKGTLRSNSLPLISANWTIKPASDDPKDIEIADFVSANLLRTTSDKYGKEYWCQSSWKAQRLPEILKMLQYGFALFYNTWKVVGTNRVLDRIQYLEPSTIDPNGWVLDDSDNIIRIERTYAKPSGEFVVREPIELDNISLYVWDMTGARYEGEPLIRSLYGPWYRKNIFLRAGLSWASKVGDAPPMGVFPKGWGDEEKEAFTEFVSMHRGVPLEEAWAVFPRGDDVGPEIKYSSAESGELDRMRSLINGENSEMSHGGATKTTLLGETSTGSRALGDTISDLERQHVTAVSRVICEWENHGVGNIPGLIESLVDENFNNVKRYPELICDDEDRVEQRKQVPVLVNAISAKAVPPLPELQQAICKRMGFDFPIALFEKAKQEADELLLKASKPDQPKKDDDEVDPTSTDGDGNKLKDPVEKTPSLETGSLATESLEDVRKRMLPMLEPMGKASGTNLRAPNFYETNFANLSSILEAYRVGENSIIAELRRLHRFAIGEFVAKARAGNVNKRNIDGLMRSRFRTGERISDSLFNIFYGIGEKGIDHVNDELELQRKSKVSLGTRVSGVAISSDLLYEFTDEMKALVAFNIGTIWSRIVREGIDEFLKSQSDQGDLVKLSQLLENYLNSLSEKPLEDLARNAASVAYNEGRDMAIVTASNMNLVDYAIRSEVLDNKTCGSCRILDGKIVKIGTPEYGELKPPNKCQGGGNCRGFYLTIKKGL